MIRAARAKDAAALARIYNHYVASTVVTFEEQPVSAREMARRMETVRKAKLPWLVAAERGDVLGYAYAGPWKSRCAYRFSVEASIYLESTQVSRGWGTKLYRALFKALEKTPVHAVVAGIALPNAASVALHEKFKMKKAAHFPEVGFKFGRWIDVGYWQRILER